MREQLSDETVKEEIKRLLGPDVLGWWGTKDGLEWHTLNKNTSQVYGIYAAMLEQLVADAQDIGLNPAYIIGYLALRIQMSCGDDQVHADIKKLINWDELYDNIKLKLES